VVGEVGSYICWLLRIDGKNYKTKTKRNPSCPPQQSVTVKVTKAPPFTKLLYATQRIPRSLIPCLPKSENKRTYE
jgi:hypothetical protein